MRDGRARGTWGPVMLKRMEAQEREELEAGFLEEARAQFRRMFDEREQADLVTFDQRESRAVEVSSRLGQWVLERHLAGDAAVAPAAGACPKCGRATGAVGAGEPEERTLQTRAGPVSVRRAEHRCAACRRRLFPPRR